MGNRKARQELFSQEQRTLWNRIRTVPRPPNRDVFAPGIGHLRMQLIVCPSFDEGSAWEVRHGPDGWCLYQPDVVEGPDIQLLGYDAVEFPAERLASYFARVTAITLPIVPDLSGCGGCDGTMHQFAVFGDLFSSWRFHWWSTPPAHWKPLVEIANEMLTAFSGTEKTAPRERAES